MLCLCVGHTFTCTFLTLIHNLVFIVNILLTTTVGIHEGSLQRILMKIIDLKIIYN